ncbi:MAG: calcium:proton exchanger [Hungatella sp.]
MQDRRSGRAASHKKNTDYLNTRVSYVKKPLAPRSRIAIGLALAGAALLIAGVYASVRAMGAAELYVAAIGFCSLLVSVFAVWYGVASFYEKDMNYILAKIGIVIGTIVIVFWLLMMMIGMRG